MNKNKELVIYGEFGGGNSSGGGGQGQAIHQPIESNDTLASRQKVRLLFAISEGIIENIDQVYLNQVPLSNYNASYEWRNGATNQALLPGFSVVETPLTTFSPVTTTTGREYFAAIPYDVNATRLTFVLSALRQVMPDGDIVGYSVSHTIYTRPSTSTGWTILKLTTKTGKASSSYSWQVEVRRPAGTSSASNWEIMVVRSTINDMDVKHSSLVSWQSVVLIYETTLNYGGTALLGLTLNDAAQFGGNIPEITIRSKGLQVKVPSNYDAVNHTYNETIPWDGALTESLFHYTANPAWHIYYILNTPKTSGGLGIAKTDIDVISLYQLSKYCDGLVSDGKGGTERRYELHNQFYTRENVPTFLMYLLNICNANITDNEFGQISIMFDHAGQAITKQVTNANVINGIFSYSSNDLESRYTVANVTYNSNVDYGKTDTVTEVDNTLITRYGIQTTDIVLPGCTSEAQARRKARWALYNNSKLTGFVTYKILFGGLVYHIGELVRLYDNDNQGATQAGMIRSYTIGASTTSIVLDRPITLEAQTYTLYFKNDSANTEEIVKTISETNGIFTTITVQGAVTPALNAIFTLAGPVQPRIVKVVKIDKSDEVYTITCVDHSELKYSYIETGIVVNIPSGDFVNISEYTTVPVGIVSVEENFSGNGVIKKSKLQIHWTWPSSGTPKYNANYKLTWKRDNQQAVFISDISTQGYDIDNPVPGVYEITVWAMNPFTGIASTPVVTTYNFRIAAGTSTLLPPENIYVNGTTGLIFNTPDLAVSFTYPAGNDSKLDSLLDYVIEVWDSTTTFKKATYIVSPNTLRGGIFYFPFVNNNSVFGTPTRQFNLRIFSRDTVGDLSTSTLVTVVNPVPVLTAWQVVGGFNSIYIKITPSLELDVTEYIVYESLTPSFIKDATTLVYAGPDVYINFKSEPGITKYFAVSIADSFGRIGANISTEQNTLAVNTDPDIYIYSGLAFTPNSPILNKVSWAAATATKNGVTITNINANSIGVLWTSGTMYIYFVPGDNNLRTNVSLVTAISEGGRILATYRGGTDISSESGKAFVSGDQLLAGSVGANALVTNTAVITNSAQIGNILESSNYSLTPGAYAGWRIDKTGYAQFNSMTISNAAGNTLFSSGTGMDWSYVINKTGFASIAKITSANIGTYIDTLAVNTAYISDAAITNAKIASLAVGTANIATAAITTAKINDLAVNTLQIAGNAVTVPTSFGGGSVSMAQGGSASVISGSFTSYGGSLNIIVSWASPARYGTVDVAISGYVNPFPLMYLTQTPVFGYLYIDGVASGYTDVVFDSGSVTYRMVLTPGVHTISFTWFALNYGGTSTQTVNSTSLLLIEAKR